MKGEDPRIFLPPGDPKGFGASEELLERAGRLLICQYALPQNIKKGNLGFLPAPSKPGSRKRWLRNLRKLNHHMIAREMRSGCKCYGVAHSTFTHLFILDIDNPETGDCDMLEGGLRTLGWAYKKFHSGRGRHLWVFFEKLPYELRAEYGGGPPAMKAVAEAFLSQYRDGLQGNIDIRGCNAQLIKLPLQFDPYHRRIVLPYDENNELICDFEQAVDYAANITRNDPKELIEFLRKYDHKASRKTQVNRSRRDNISCHSSMDESFQEWLGTVRVGSGESNDFMFHFVHRCWRAGLTRLETLDAAKYLYDKGRDDGRLSCKDKWPEWKSKAIGRMKKLWSLGSMKKKARIAKFYRRDLQWIAKHSVLTIDPLFLAIHLWAHRLNDADEYFLSRRTAKEWGITSRQFRDATERFLASGLLKVVAPGRQAPPSRSGRGRATSYRLSDYPDPAGARLHAVTPLQLLAEYEEYIQEEEY